MCKRIFTHRMHHDVAAPMIMQTKSLTPDIYANPRRTNYHTCELEPRTWLLNTLRRCAYHTCCIPDERIEYCKSFASHVRNEGGQQQPEDLEPEECTAFALEHLHEFLPYFGSHESLYENPVPATWRRMVRKHKFCSGEEELFRAFDPAQRARWVGWEEAVFRECETLYTLSSDYATLYAHYEDLRANFDALVRECPHSAEATLQVAEDQARRVEERLVEQRSVVDEAVFAMKVSAVAHRASARPKGTTLHLHLDEKRHKIVEGRIRKSKRSNIARAGRASRPAR
ncbi:hypothetical protein F4808DRAFT_473521 [Astrocystis sublimbata]|nr:hypothetical protein F4808DRAFT_473521 [Astrocystis sublimbata]